MSSQTDRINFTEITKEVIRRRAGYRCCKCDKTLVGPGATTSDFVELGQCAHIYVAKPTGPRDQSHLTEEQLRSPENGLYLCNDCHKLVDGKLREKKYRAEQLLQIKSIHEYKIAVEMGNDVMPLNWIKSVKIEESPNIKVGTIIDFAKTTVLYGNNGNGKSSIIEMLYEVLSSSILKRWNGKRMKAVIDVDNPVKYPVTVTLDKIVSYLAGGCGLAIFPYQMDVIYIRDKERPTEVKDDLQYVAEYLGKDRNNIEAMIQVADFSNAVMVSKAEIEEVRKNPYRECRIKVWRKDYNTGHEWKLQQLSDTERSRFVLDLVVSYLSAVSRFRPAILLIDWGNIFSFSEGLIEQYMRLFQNPNMNFQTIIASHTKWQNVEWSGWNLVDLNNYEIVEDW